MVIEEEIDILEGRKKNKTLVTELLEEELARQKEIIESKKKWFICKKNIIYQKNKIYF